MLSHVLVLALSAPWGTVGFEDFNSLSAFMVLFWDASEEEAAASDPPDDFEGSATDADDPRPDVEDEPSARPRPEGRRNPRELGPPFGRGRRFQPGGPPGPRGSGDGWRHAPPRDAGQGHADEIPSRENRRQFSERPQRPSAERPFPAPFPPFRGFQPAERPAGPREFGRAGRGPVSGLSPRRDAALGWEPLFRALDRDANGVIDRREFSRAVRAIMVSDRPAQRRNGRERE